MNKIVISGLSLVVIISIITIFSKTTNTDMNPLFNENVEILTQCEGGQLVPSYNCYDEFNEAGPSGWALKLRDCKDCKLKWTDHVSKPDTCYVL